MLKVSESNKKLYTLAWAIFQANALLIEWDMNEK